MSFLDKFGFADKLHIKWKELNSINQIDSLVEESKERPVAIFKHSTRCGISHMVKDGLHANYDIEHGHLGFYYLDLISFRQISNEIAHRFNVPHQSPQIVLLRHGRAVYNASHHMINVDAIKEHLEK